MICLEFLDYVVLSSLLWSTLLYDKNVFFFMLIIIIIIYLFIIDKIFLLGYKYQVEKTFWNFEFTLQCYQLVMTELLITKKLKLV